MRRLKTSRCVLKSCNTALSNKTLKSLSESYKTYLFYSDRFKFKPLLKDRLQYFESVFTAANKKEFYYKLGAKRVITVPWACDTEFYKRIELDKIYNVSFIGTAYSERKWVINRLEGVKVFGDFWDKKLYIFKDFFGNGKNVFGPVYGEDYIKVINQTKINLNIQGKSSVIAVAPTMRTFEVAGCAGFQISDHLPAMSECFPFIPTCKSIDELKELIKHYLDSEAKREEITIKSQERCYKFYKCINGQENQLVINLPCPVVSTLFLVCKTLPCHIPFLYLLRALRHIF